MGLRVTNQTNLNDLFDKFASVPEDKANATGPDPKRQAEAAKKAHDKAHQDSKKP